MMERRMKRKFHVRCEAGENLEITSKVTYRYNVADGKKPCQRFPMKSISSL